MNITTLLAVMVTNVGEILHKEIFQTCYLKLEVNQRQTFRFNGKFLSEKYLFSFSCLMFSVYLNWIDNSLQTDSIPGYSRITLLFLIYLKVEIFSSSQWYHSHNMKLMGLFKYKARLQEIFPGPGGLVRTCDVKLSL